MSNEVLWFLMLGINFLAILFLYRFFGRLGLYAWIPIAVIIANIQVLKTVEIFGITATLGNIVYATSFLATDILSENHGKNSARHAVIMGFTALLSLSLLMPLALLFLPAESDFAQESLSTLFSLLPRVALGSFTAYAFSQAHDVWLYSLLIKRRPQARWIWLRNNLSTLISQLLDTLIFTTIAFAGVFSWNVFFEIAVTTYLLKGIVSLLDTPLVYLARHWKDKNLIKDIIREG